MQEKDFEFELYRLNVVAEEPDLFTQDFQRIESDADIELILQQSTVPTYGIEVEGSRSNYKWVLREYFEYRNARGVEAQVLSVTLARSMTARQGHIVTDDGIVEGASEAEPPLADTVKLFFHLSRHLVAVERLSVITGNGRWKSAFREIIGQAAKDLHYLDSLELEPVPRQEEILSAFRSFQRLNRLRVFLRLPNPELSRYSRRLYEDMIAGGIREYLQDMKSSRGLSQEDGRLPHASAELAQAGYKKGAVLLEGIRNGRQDSVETGGKAARGKLQRLRDYVRGLGVNLHSQEGQRIIDALLREIDRLAPPPQDGSQ